MPAVAMSGLSLLVLILAVECPPTAVTARMGGKMPVGGRLKVKDVKSNEEVQKLGRYSVEQYNRQQRQGLPEEEDSGGGGGELRFKEVVEAEKQVVSGIKYYLKIKAKTAVGAQEMFDAVVLVKPWAQSKELLKFGQSASSHVWA